MAAGTARRGWRFRTPGGSRTALGQEPKCPADPSTQPPLSVPDPGPLPRTEPLTYTTSLHPSSILLGLDSVPLRSCPDHLPSHPSLNSDWSELGNGRLLHIMGGAPELLVYSPRWVPFHSDSPYLLLRPSPQTLLGETFPTLSSRGKSPCFYSTNKPRPTPLSTRRLSVGPGSRLRKVRPSP